MNQVTESAAAELDWDLADRLRKSLRVTGISREEMAAVVGTTPVTVSRWTNGHTRPKRGMLAAWAMRCGPPFTVEWLEVGTLDLRPAEAPEVRRGQVIQPSRWRERIAGGERCNVIDLRERVS